MPGLLENSPYAGFNPANDPYLRSIPRQKNLQTGNDFYKGLLAGPVGMVGDIEPFYNPFGIARQAVDRALPNAGIPQQIFPTSEQVGGLLGADTETQDFNVGLLGAPDLTDVSRMSAGLLGHTLFHGTPHRFDKFDLKAIGTGEGAQAYGHGLYFAENPSVAGSYKNNLSGSRFVNAKGEAFDPSDMLQNPNIRATIQKTDGDLDAAIQRAKDLQESIPGTDGARLAAEDMRVLEQMKADGGIKREAGHLYEVEIPDEITAKMLDWDAPLSEQPESVRKALESIKARTPAGTDEIGFGFGPHLMPDGSTAYRGIDDAQTGGELHAALSRAVGKERASDLLNEAGIPGIRFYDGSSRTAQEGTRNIVVFNPDDITQVKRDSELVYKAK